MKKLLMVFALSLPLMAQEVEVKETEGKKDTEVKKQYDKKKWNRGGMKRGGMDMREKRMMMAKRKQMRKKRAVRSFVRVVVIGGVAYYVGYRVGKKHQKDAWDKPKRPIWMGDREKK